LFFGGENQSLNVKNQGRGFKYKTVAVFLYQIFCNIPALISPDQQRDITAKLIIEIKVVIFIEVLIWPKKHTRYAILFS
jgi:hypothetical protein